MSLDEKVALEETVTRVSSDPSSPPLPARPAPTAPDPEGERRVRQAIKDNALRNIELLNEIMKTMDAVHALANNETRLKFVNDELTAQSKLSKETSETSKTVLDKYTKTRDSFTKKWIYVLTHMRNNLERKVKECEEQYHQALAAQSRAEQREQKLKQDKEVIEKENETVSKEAKRHGAAHNELDQLYSEIFDGKTPGFPDEDEFETQFRARKDEYDATVHTLKQITGASKELALLKTTIAKAQKENTSAKYELETSFFGGADYALVFLDRCARLIDQAQRVHRKIASELPQPLDRDFVQSHGTLDKNLVHAYSNASEQLRRQYAYASTSDVFRCIQNVFDELNLASEQEELLAKKLKTYEITAKQAMKITSRALEDARQALQEVRQNAFEITVGHGAAPPQYQEECCDRAEGFEREANTQCERVPDPVIDDSGLPPPPSYDATVSGRFPGRQS